MTVRVIEGWTITTHESGMVKVQPPMEDGYEFEVDTSADGVFIHARKLDTSGYYPDMSASIQIPWAVLEALMEFRE